MKINTKVRYGLRAMIEIASDTNVLGVLQKEIADKQEIPLNYLDTIISGLRNAGLIVNTSGRSSGYLPAKKADRIFVYDIYRAFEPEIILVQCSCETNECSRSQLCPITDYWFTLNNLIKESMRSTSLSDLIKNKSITN